MSDTTYDTGQAQDGDQRHHDVDGAAQLADALIRQLERIGGARDTTQTVLAPPQLRLVTHYSALSNMLANFGRHGPSRIGILPPSTLNADARRLTFPGLQEAAQRAGRTATNFVTYDGSGQFLERGVLTLDGSGEFVGSVKAVEIRTVEIEDADGIPFLLGFVINTPVSNTSVG